MTKRLKQTRLYFIPTVYIKKKCTVKISNTQKIRVYNKKKRLTINIQK